MSFWNDSIQLITKKPRNFKKPLFYNETKTAGIPMNPGKPKVDKALEDYGFPVIVLRDLHLVYKGKEAWYDYIIISTKYILIMEVNNNQKQVSDRQREFIYKILLDWLPENNPRMWDYLLKTVVVSTSIILGQQLKQSRKEKQMKVKAEELAAYLRRLQRANTKDYWIPEEGMHVLAEIFMRYHEPCVQVTDKIDEKTNE